MKTRRILGILIALALAIAIGWWLFRDPHRRHTGPAETGEEIRFAHFGASEDFEFWRQIIDQFEKAHPGARVRQEYVAELGDHYNIKLRQQILSQSLPEIVLVQMTTFQELSGHFENLTQLIGEPTEESKVREGSLAPVPALSGEPASADLEPQIFPQSGPKKAVPSPHLDPALLEQTGVRAFQVENEQRGLPVSGGNLLIFLNQKSFHKASEFHGKPVELPGEDWTAAQFLRTAEKLTCDFDRDGVTDQFGFWLPRWVYYLPFIWSFGADITDEQATRWTFSGPTAQAVMRFYRQLATGDRVAPREEEVPQMLQDTGFLTGKTAMCVNGPWFIAFLDQTDLAGDYVVAPIPRGPGGRATRITWDGMVMKRNLPAAQRERAWRFIAWTLSKDVQGRLARLGRALPARVDVQAQFVSADPPRRKPFIDALSYSRLQPPLPRFEALDRAITRHFGDAVDPTRAFEALTMLDALARDPAVVGAFTSGESSSP